MIKLDNITNEILDKIDPIGFEQKGAFIVTCFCCFCSF